MAKHGIENVANGEQEKYQRNNQWAGEKRHRKIMSGEGGR